MWKTLMRSRFSLDNKISKDILISIFSFRSVVTIKSENLSASKLLKNRQEIQLKLEKLLNIKPMTAVGIVASNKNFTHASPLVLADNYEMCIRENISIETILRYPIILTDPNLLPKIKKIKLISMDLNSTIIFSLLSLRKLNTFLEYSDDLLERIQKFSKDFDVSESDACEILCTKSFLLTLSIDHIDSNMKLFKEFGISNEAMIKDMWIFKYSEAFLSKRFELFKEYDVKYIKTWMIRCPEKTLLRHIKREAENRNILGESSVAEYLSLKLKCDENIVNYLIEKNKQLKTKNILKLCEMIDFLYKHGFTSIQICRVPKILLHSRQTIDKRIKQLINLGIDLKHISLYVFTKSQKQYMQYVENALKIKQILNE